MFCEKPVAKKFTSFATFFGTATLLNTNGRLLLILTLPLGAQLMIINLTQGYVNKMWTFCIYQICQFLSFFQNIAGLLLVSSFQMISSFSLAEMKHLPCASTRIKSHLKNPSFYNSFKATSSRHFRQNLFSKTTWINFFISLISLKFKMRIIYLS